MFGPLDFVLGGLAPLVAAAVAFAALWSTTRRSGAAWSAGVVAGYATGVFALAARANGLAAAATGLIHANESHEWLPLLALVAVLPATAAALARRRWLEWLLAAPLCVAAPAALLWSKYRASQQLREAGFSEDAITPSGAAGMLALIAVATLAAWWLWRQAEGQGLGRSRTLIAIVCVIGAAAVTALTGALVLGQAFGVLAAALAGCAIGASFVSDAAGPDAARGPTLVLFGGLLVAAVAYSRLPAWHTAVLGSVIALAAGWLPAVARLRPTARVALRAVLSVAPLAIIVWRATSMHLASSQDDDDAMADGGYEDMYAPAQPTPGPQALEQAP